MKNNWLFNWKWSWPFSIENGQYPFMWVDDVGRDLAALSTSDIEQDFQTL